MTQWDPISQAIIDAAGPFHEAFGKLSSLGEATHFVKSAELVSFF